MILLEIARIFFKLGLTSFGGPAAHISLIEQEIVEKRKWMSTQHYVDLIGVTSIIPGPNSTEMAMHCGLHRAGRWGLFVAGIAFIFPAFSLTLLLSWIYVQSGQMPYLDSFLFGIKPAMIVVIAFSIIKLGKKTWTTIPNIVISTLVFLFAALGYSEIMAVLIGGVLGVASRYLPFSSSKLFSVALPVLFFECLKIGAILYGSGYVLIAYVESVFVTQLGWLTPGLLLDAVAIGQLTPGPVLTTATVIGYFISGFPGALVATLGIFLPSFIFVLVVNPIIPKLRSNNAISGFLDGVNSGAVALMLYVTIRLSFQILTNWQSGVVLFFAFLLMWYKPFGAGAITLVIGSSLLGRVLLLI